MLWDNIYKPSCASTAVAAFWRQHALKTWQNISFLTIIRDNKIHLPLVLQLKASNSIFSKMSSTHWEINNAGACKSEKPAVHLGKNPSWKNTWSSKHIMKSGISIHVISPQRKWAIFFTWYLLIRSMIMAFCEGKKYHIYKYKTKTDLRDICHKILNYYTNWFSVTAF